MDSQQTPGNEDPETEVAELHRQLQQYAEQANWSQVALLTKRRNALLDVAPYNLRSKLLESAIDCNQRIMEVAIHARRATAERLTELKRGRDSASRYADNRQLGL